MSEKSISHVERGKKGAAVRWGIPTLAAGNLKIGAITLDCFVLEDEKRVLGTRSFLEALDMKRGGYKTGDRRIARFVKGKLISPYVSSGLLANLEQPIKIVLPSGGHSLAYPAESLIELCNVVIKARREGVLQKQQYHIADMAEMLVGGFATVGVIGLIDEVTGYQYFRERTALATILEDFVAKEAAAWAKTFPDAFYRELFRLQKIKTMNLNDRPRKFGKITNDIVYKRLAPGVLPELEKRNPRNGSGRRSRKHFQWLTERAKGELNRHLGQVIGFMIVSKNWKQFMSLMDNNLPVCLQVAAEEIITEETDG